MIASVGKGAIRDLRARQAGASCAMLRVTRRRRLTGSVAALPMEPDCVSARPRPSDATHGTWDPLTATMPAMMLTKRVAASATRER